MSGSEEEWKPRPLMGAAPGSLQDTTLIWRMEAMRDLFKVQRMWPSFVGAKDVQKSGFLPGKSNSKSNEDHLLPVLLWPEQKRYLALKGMHDYGTEAFVKSHLAQTSNKSNSGSNKERNSKSKGKRKREDDTEEKDESEQDNAPLAKKARSEGFLSNMASFFSFAFAPFTTLSRRRKITNADAQLTIFSDCHERGYFIGPGHVYGGDFNIYKGGDPSNSHSTATVRVVRRKSISGRDLLSFSRVQNQVAKSAVLAYVDPSSGGARFLVANFQNVSDRL